MRGLHLPHFACHPRRQRGEPLPVPLKAKPSVMEVYAFENADEGLAGPKPNCHLPLSQCSWLSWHDYGNLTFVGYLFALLK